MNILILGDSDSVFVRDYCEYVLKEKRINAVLLTQRFSTRYMRDYRDNDVKVVKWPDFFGTGIRKQSGILLKLFKTWRSLKREIGFVNEIDAIHVHYVEPLHLVYFFPFWKRARERVLTFWGGDLNGITQKKKTALRYFLKNSTTIVLMIQNQLEQFQLVFGHKYDNKIQIIDFGNSQLDIIDNVTKKYTHKECKQHFGMASDKLTVHVGYNASSNQQHLQMIEQIALLPQEALNKIELVFHVSYGYWGDFEKYRQELITVMDKIPVKYIFCDSYLQDEELAVFRCTCDIFVYGQKNDARSASPLEYVYAGARFICPGWLAGNYVLLEEGNIKYYVYEDFDVLEKVILRCINDIEQSEKRISMSGRQRIREEISWDILAEKWRALYED